MEVEEPLFASCEDGDTVTEGVVVGECRSSMWGGLEKLHGSVTEAAEG